MIDRLAIIAVVFVAGCSGASAPPSVEPTLAAIETLGLACGDGVPDNVPSGLTQWRCAGTLAAVDWTVLVDGAPAGVVGISLDVRGPGGAAVAGSAFDRLVRSVPPLRAAPGLGDALAGWTGGQRQTKVGGARISAECLPSPCVITVVSTSGTRDVLRLP